MVNGIDPDFKGLVDRDWVREKQRWLPFRTSAAFVSRRAFLETGGFLTGKHYGEDVELWTRMVLEGYRVTVLPEKVIKVHFRKNSLSRCRGFRQFLMDKFVREYDSVYFETGKHIDKNPADVFKEMPFRRQIYYYRQYQFGKWLARSQEAYMKRNWVVMIIFLAIAFLIDTPRLLRKINAFRHS
jgi:GT2 family glycosyltransferase